MKALSDTTDAKTEPPEASHFRRTIAYYFVVSISTLRVLAACLLIVQAPGMDSVEKRLSRYGAFATLGGMTTQYRTTLLAQSKLLTEPCADLTPPVP